MTADALALDQGCGFQTNDSVDRVAEQSGFGAYASPRNHFPPTALRSTGPPKRRARKAKPGLLGDAVQPQHGGF